MKVAVIGAGVIGITTAYELATKSVFLNAMAPQPKNAASPTRAWPLWVMPHLGPDLAWSSTCSHICGNVTHRCASPMPA